MTHAQKATLIMIDVMTERPARLPAPSQFISGSTCHSIDQLVSDTLVVWTPDVLATPGRSFWAKLEGHNPGGIKDRPGLHLIQSARERGDLLPRAPVIESTSGTLGLGLALAGQVSFPRFDGAVIGWYVMIALSMPRVALHRSYELKPPESG